MSDFIKMQLGNGNYHYINLDNIIEIRFNDDEKKVEFQHEIGNNYILNETKEGYESLKQRINKEMEKRILP